MNHQRFAGVLRLGLSMLLIAVFWLQVLPWIAAQPKMAAHLRRLENQGIDPCAMFYTELDAMTPILHRLEHR